VVILRWSTVELWWFAVDYGGTAVVSDCVFFLHFT
jgi:hypothetical protein